MHSLAFRALDRHVIDGRADEPALIAGEITLSYAQLLHESASLAGGLRDLGVVTGTAVSIEVPERSIQVVSLLAVVRFAAHPGEPEGIVIDGPRVITADETFDYDLVLRAGRVDPARALAADPEGYDDRVRARYGGIIETLLAGGTLG